MTFTGHKICSAFTDQTTVLYWNCYPTTLPPDGMSDPWEHQLWDISSLCKQEEGSECSAALHVAQPKGSRTWARLTIAYFLPTPLSPSWSPHSVFLMFHSAVLDVDTKFSHKSVKKKKGGIGNLATQKHSSVSHQWKISWHFQMHLLGANLWFQWKMTPDERDVLPLGSNRKVGGMNIQFLWRAGSDVSPRLTCSHNSIQQPHPAVPLPAGKARSQGRRYSCRSSSPSSSSSPDRQTD